MMRGTNNSKLARRLAAGGHSSAQAVAESSPAQWGPLGRVSNWNDLEASKFGMPAALLAITQGPGVTDVLVNGGEVWVDRGGGLVRSDLKLGSEEECRLIAIRMAAAAGRRLDDASPIVDATLQGLLRLHAVLPPLSSKGVSISLRVIRSTPFGMPDLIANGTVDPDLAQTLTKHVKKSRSILVAGATGSGKTTLLATLLGLVPKQQRIVCIEEVSEIVADHPHVVHLQSRSANVEGEGELGLEDLVRAAVRMRPDRLVLGECRGPEVREVLTAMNTGHRGGFATIHANSIEDVPARLTALGMLGGLEPGTVAALAKNAFEVVIQMRRRSDGRRYVSEIGHLETKRGELRGCLDSDLRTNLSE